MSTRNRKNALLPGAKPVKVVQNGSGATSKPQPQGQEQIPAPQAPKKGTSDPVEADLTRSTPIKGSQKKDSQPQLEGEAELKRKDNAEPEPDEEPPSKEEKVGKGVPKNKFSNTVKVIRLANAADDKQKDVVLATLQMKEVRKLSLKQIRQKFKSIDEPDTFCFHDQSPADDSLLLEVYLEQALDDEVTQNKFPQPVKEGEPEVGAEQQSAVHKSVLYLTPRPAVKAATTAKNLTLKKFAVRVFEWSGGENGVASRGNLQSSKLDAPDASLMTLAGLRKILATCTKMSVSPKTHQFCTQSGETVVDEAMTFFDYLQLEETLSDTKADLPSVHVFYKLAHPKNEPHKINLEDLPGKITSADIKLTGNEFANGKRPDTFVARNRTFDAPPVGKASRGAATNEYALDASYLTDSQWAEVLRNCGAMYGWVVDRQKNQIIRAPKPAFQLRAKLSEDETHAIPDFVKKAPEAESPALTQITAADIDKARKKVGDWSSRDEVKGRLPDLWTRPGATSPQEAAPTSEPKTAKDDIQAARENDTPAGASKEGDTEMPAQSAGLETTPSPAAPTPDQEPLVVKVQVPTLEQVALNPALARYLPRTAVGKAVYTALPSFQVNDDSKIEVTVSSHEFETSMARNDFSNQSGGYGGFAANVSAGYSKESSTATKDTNNTYKKTMIAKFLLPRADILLHPSDLEPTPELKAALERIRTHKRIVDLRKLNSDFGQLWCQRITVGGRLQSTSILTETTSLSEREQKDAFKRSVGLQVTTPIGVGAGVKSSKETGKQEAKTQTDIKKDESNVFEAVGGDTILAANPDAWSSTVADYRTWRVIDRDSLSSLADAISAIPGYAKVRSWFMQAVPTLSKYIELPPSREIHLRFKLTAPTSQLSLSHLKKAEHYDDSTDPIYYLGHSTGADVKPVKNDLAISNNAWAQVDITDAKSLFSPQSYRAPVLLGYSSNLVGDSAYGSQYSQDYANSLWNVSAPFNDALAHGVLVCISTVPLSNQGVTAGAPATAAPNVPLSLVVFRNQQSVFLPGLSDAPERHYWRILKHGAKSNGEHIKEGDEIYFAWAVKDQTAGFRDFAQDVFGRRRVQFPHDLTGKVLYMKLPWPRFEPLAEPAKGAAAVPNTMLLTDDAPAVNNAPQMAFIKTVPGMKAAAEALSRGTNTTDMSVFGLQDVRFRVDVVGNDGRGEVGDHLLKDLAQGEKKPDATIPGLNEARWHLEELYKFYEKLMFL